MPPCVAGDPKPTSPKTPKQRKRAVEHASRQRRAFARSELRLVRGAQNSNIACGWALGESGVRCNVGLPSGGISATMLISVLPVGLPG
jgi:hypothetical protein